jgi:hypothetical protein
MRKKASASPAEQSGQNLMIQLPVSNTVRMQINVDRLSIVDRLINTRSI